MGDHHHWRKTYAYEGSSAIPFIVKFPKDMKVVKTAGTVIDQPVELRDFLPTFLDLAEGQIPADMDGKSLATLVKEENPSWRRWIDLEHATCYSDRNYWCALTDGKIKYIWFVHTGEEQLFDLVKDPKETTDVSKDRKYRKQLETLREAMKNHLSERGEEWVKDGQLVTRDKTLLYSPNYPPKKQ